MLNVFVDESGTFTSSKAALASWCVVCAFTYPDSEDLQVELALGRLKLSCGYSAGDEVKLSKLKEEHYFDFLAELGTLNASAFVVGTDSHFNTEDVVGKHQMLRCDTMLETAKRVNEIGRKYYEQSIEQFRSISLQLYVQYWIQLCVVQQVLNRGIVYWVQRCPKELDKFRWIFDAKELVKKTRSEESFEHIGPALLQALSLDEPTPMVDGFDYGSLQDAYFSEIPGYLVDEIPDLEGKKGLDLQKIFRQGLSFQDSRTYSGLQCADLLASGFRRLLRLGFKDNETAAWQLRQHGN